jgi:hypothetical protein
MFHFSTAAEIERIGLGVSDRSLPKSEWTHAAHFAAAFWLTRRSGPAAVHEKTCFLRRSL